MESIVVVVGVGDVVDADVDAGAGADSGVDFVYLSPMSAVLPHNLVYYNL